MIMIMMVMMMMMMNMDFYQILLKFVNKFNSSTVFAFLK
jgi:hypothetical protein